MCPQVRLVYILKGRFSFFPEKEFSELDPFPVLDPFFTFDCQKHRTLMELKPLNVGIDFQCKFFFLRIADPGCLFRIRIFPSRIPDPGSQRHRIPEPDPQQKFKYFLSKTIDTKRSKVWSRMFMPDPETGLFPFRIPDPGIKNTTEPGSARLALTFGTSSNFW